MEVSVKRLDSSDSATGKLIPFWSMMVTLMRLFNAPLHMTRLALIVSILTTVSLIASYGTALGAGPSMLTDYAAEQVGLQVVWTGALPMRVSEGLPPMLRYHVMEKSAQTLYDLMVDNQRVLSMSPQQLGRNGIPLGEEGVKKALDFEIRKLARRGKTGSIAKVEVPIARLFACGHDGTLAAMDAETGRILWSLRVGNPGISPLGFDVNDDIVSVISGANLHVFNTSEGKDLGFEYVEGSPIFGPLVGSDYTFAWMPLGAIEGYLTENILAEPYRERVAGGMQASPVRNPSGTRIAWPTDRGYVYVLSTAGTPKVPFRLEPSNAVVGSVAMAPGDLVVAVSQNGTAYCLDANNGGKVKWRTIVGASILRSPIVMNGKVFLLTPDGTLIVLNLIGGDFAWPSNLPGISDIIGGDGKDNIYAFTTSKNLISINSNTGEITGSTRLSGEVRAVRQNISDRVYLVGPTGQCQCLIPRGKTRLTPVYRLADQAAKQSLTRPAGQPATAAPTGEMAPSAAGAADPFGSGADMAPAATSAPDPFGAPAETPPPAAGMADPFGAAFPN